MTERKHPVTMAGHRWCRAEEIPLPYTSPQFESWNDNLLKARAAVSVTTKASANLAYGIVFFIARTTVDRSRGTVMLEDLQIIRVNFPKASGDGTNYRKMIAGSMVKWPQSIALDRLQADLALNQATMKTERIAGVKNDPPRIFFSTTPAVLVLIDGTPVPRAIPGTTLMRIINTRALLLLDTSSGRYYLYVSDHWEESQSIGGPWKPAVNPPESLAFVLEEAYQSTATDLLADEKTTGPISVFVSTEPSELLITRGKPDLQHVDGTELLSCSNSDNEIFFNLKDQRFYILLAGRWFSSTSLENGPWKFVPGRELPADFANIPENHPKGNVLASVPGTMQAKEAVISSSIPQTATVRRNVAKATVTYDGEPVFNPIAGTPLKYAINAPMPVIEVDPESYYCVANGVWFAATSPQGPWVVTDRVPAVIYTIPSNSPIHYVVYVRIYGSTPEFVYVGYTPGYYGALISNDGTVIYGTGYYYYPWIGTVWYGYPVTWGCGLYFGCYAWGWGWGWGYFYGWRPFFRPWWGPWWGWGSNWWHPWGFHGSVSLHINAYNRWGGNAIVRGPSRSFRNQTKVLPGGKDHYSGRHGHGYRRGKNRR